MSVVFQSKPGRVPFLAHFTASQCFFARVQKSKFIRPATSDLEQNRQKFTVNVFVMGLGLRSPNGFAFIWQPQACPPALKPWMRTTEQSLLALALNTLDSRRNPGRSEAVFTWPLRLHSEQLLAQFSNQSPSLQPSSVYWPHDLEKRTLWELPHYALRRTPWPCEVQVRSVLRRRSSTDKQAFGLGLSTQGLVSRTSYIRELPREDRT